jgi:hypothetical protein
MGIMAAEEAAKEGAEAKEGAAEVAGRSNVTAEQVADRGARYTRRGSSFPGGLGT